MTTHDTTCQTCIQCITSRYTTHPNWREDLSRVVEHGLSLWTAFDAQPRELCRANASAVEQIMQPASGAETRRLSAQLTQLLRGAGRGGDFWGARRRGAPLARSLCWRVASPCHRVNAWCAGNLLRWFERPAELDGALHSFKFWRIEVFALTGSGARDLPTVFRSWTPCAARELGRASWPAVVCLFSVVERSAEDGALVASEAARSLFEYALRGVGLRNRRPPVWLHAVQNHFPQLGACQTVWEEEGGEEAPEDGAPVLRVGWRLEARAQLEELGERQAAEWMWELHCRVLAFLWELQAPTGMKVGSFELRRMRHAVLAPASAAGPFATPTTPGGAEAETETEATPDNFVILT